MKPYERSLIKIIGTYEAGLTFFADWMSWIQDWCDDKGYSKPHLRMESWGFEIFCLVTPDPEEPETEPVKQPDPQPDLQPSNKPE